MFLIRTEKEPEKLGIEVGTETHRVMALATPLLLAKPPVNKSSRRRNSYSISCLLLNDPNTSLLLLLPASKITKSRRLADVVELPVQNQALH